MTENGLFSNSVLTWKITLTGFGNIRKLNICSFISLPYSLTFIQSHWILTSQALVRLNLAGRESRYRSTPVKSAAQDSHILESRVSGWYLESIITDTGKCFLNIQTTTGNMSAPHMARLWLCMVKPPSPCARVCCSPLHSMSSGPEIRKLGTKMNLGFFTELKSSILDSFNTIQFTVSNFCEDRFHQVCY